MDQKDKPKSPTRFINIFKPKNGQVIKYLSDQDKKHIRIISIIKMAQSGDINAIINHAFTEKFKFDEKSQTVIYEIKLIEERNKTIYADS